MPIVDLTAALQEAGHHTLPAKVPVPQVRPATTAITVHCNPEVREQLKRLALDQHTTMRRLICQALNELFASHHLPEIAQ